MKIMKIIFISFFLFSFINSYCVPEEDELVKLSKIRKYKHCEERTSSYELTENNAYRCCYMKYSVDSKNYEAYVHTCILITQNQYDNIEDYIERYEDQYNLIDLKIDCSSFYLQFGLLFILMFLL